MIFFQGNMFKKQTLSFSFLLSTSLVGIDLVLSSQFYFRTVFCCFRKFARFRFRNDCNLLTKMVAHDLKCQVPQRQLRIGSDPYSRRVTSVLSQELGHVLKGNSPIWAMKEKPACLGYIGDSTSQFYRDCNPTWMCLVGDFLRILPW